MKNYLLSAFAVSMAALAFSQAPAPSTLPIQTPECGHIDRIPLYSTQLADSIAIDVWLPEGYDAEGDARYPVIYMHDGQNLYDASTTWNHQSWEMDSVVSELVNRKEIVAPIIVGIHSDPDRRVSQLMPQDAVADAGLDRLMAEVGLEGEPVLGNQYAAFVVESLKPYIDDNYLTLPDRDDTFVMGSSMGGLMSLYLYCLYPDTFGGAGCLSTHWYGSLANDDFGNAMMEFVENYLPDPDNRKIYFDHGTTTIDAYYGPWNEKAVNIALRHGYELGESIDVFVDEGAPHNEDAWKRRVSIPLRFLLPKPEK